MLCKHRDYGKSGVWIRFLPIDSFSTHRFRPKGLKEIRAKPLVLADHRMAQPCDYLWKCIPTHKNPAWRSLATCRDDAGWQMYNLSEVDILGGVTRFLPIDSDLKA